MNTIKEISIKIYLYFSWGYYYFSAGYSLCKKIYEISLSNESKSKTVIPIYAGL